MRQLVVQARFPQIDHHSAVERARKVDGCDQPQVTVENPEQVVEIAGLRRVTRNVA